MLTKERSAEWRNKGSNLSGTGFDWKGSQQVIYIPNYIKMSLNSPAKPILFSNEIQWIQTRSIRTPGYPFMNFFPLGFSTNFT